MAGKPNYVYERGVMLDGTAAIYPVDGAYCTICGLPGDYAVRWPTVALQAFDAPLKRVEPAQVLLPCGHVVEPPAGEQA